MLQLRVDWEAQYDIAQNWNGKLYATALEQKTELYDIAVGGLESVVGLGTGIICRHGYLTYYKILFTT